MHPDESVDFTFKQKLDVRLEHLEIYTISLITPEPLPTDLRTDSRFAPSQWEMSLQSNTVSRWRAETLNQPCDLINIRPVVALKQSEVYGRMKNICIIYSRPGSVYFH